MESPITSVDRALEVVDGHVLSELPIPQGQAAKDLMPVHTAVAVALTKELERLGVRLEADVRAASISNDPFAAVAALREAVKAGVLKLPSRKDTADGTR